MQFGVIDTGGEDQHSDGHKEPEKKQLVDAGLHSQEDDLEATVVLHHLQNTHGTEYSRYTNNVVGQLQIVTHPKVWVGQVDDAEDDHREHCQDVDDVEEGTEEAQLERAGDEPDDELDQEEEGAEVVDAA